MSLNLYTATTIHPEAQREPRFSARHCDALFNAVLTHDNPYPEIELPDVIHLDYRQEQFIRCYGICQQLWQEGVDRKRLHRIIGKIWRYRALSEEDQVAFRHMRARFKHLRFAFAAFAEEHRYPTAFHGLVALMGFVQDAFKNGQYVVVGRAAILLGLCLGRVPYFWITRSIERFQPSSTESFRDYVRDQIRFICLKLGQAQVTAKEFHQIRMAISRQVALYDNLKTLYPSAYHHSISQYLSTINGMMGSLHDELVARKFNESQDYGTDTFVMPAEIRQRLTTLVSRYPGIAVC